MTSSRSSQGQSGGGDSLAHVVQGGPGIVRCHPRRHDESAASLSHAFGKCLGIVGASVTDAARWCEVDRRTIQRWLAGEQPVSVAAVMRSRRLWPVFLDELRSVTLGRTGS